jgi:hypothetical protein
MQVGFAWPSRTPPRPIQCHIATQRVPCLPPGKASYARSRYAPGIGTAMRASNIAVAAGQPRTVTTWEYQGQ